MSTFLACLPYLLALVGVAGTLALFGRAWIKGLFESEGVPSVRLSLAAVVVVFCLFMDAAGRLTDAARTGWLGFAEILLALGVVKVTASRFAPKPTEDLTAKAAAKNEADGSQQQET